MATLQFIQTTPEELQAQIVAGIQVVLSDFVNNYKPATPHEYLTREQTAQLLDIDLSTLHKWCKTGKLSPLGKGKRVYFLRSEIDASMIRLNEI